MSLPDGPGVQAAAGAADGAGGRRPQPTPASAIGFLMLLQNLKVTKRTGWVRKGVQGPESIADHMYRMSMMALIATDSNVDITRCIKMALVHDVAEAIVGDITPHCQVSASDKYDLEFDAIGQVKALLGEDTAAASEVEALWLEYEAAASPEALLVKDFDKLEMILTAYQYEVAQPGMALQEFYDSTEGRFKTGTGRAWAAELVRRRGVHQQRVQEGAGSSAAEEAGRGPPAPAAEEDGDNAPSAKKVKHTPA